MPVSLVGLDVKVQLLFWQASGQQAVTQFF
jgi:hypothetical protein